MGLLENSIGLGYPATTSTSLRLKQKVKQKAKQPLPILLGLLLAVIAITGLYKFNTHDVSSLNVQQLWSSEKAEVSEVVAPIEAEITFHDDTPEVELPEEVYPGDVSDDVDQESDDQYAAEQEDEDEDEHEDDSSSYSDSDYDNTMDYGFGDYDDQDFVIVNTDEEDDDAPEYREIFSESTRDRRYFPIFSDGPTLINPNIIPHPTQYDMWIVVARRESIRDHTEIEEQLICTAGFYEGTLICAEEPTVMPVSPSIEGSCDGSYSYINMQPGPRDARMFYGPDAPYIMYGSQSQYSCLGMWIQDARTLLEVFAIEQSTGSQVFKNATEVQRPGPIKEIEKNFFIFWDSDGEAYAHYELFPERSFARLDYDGSATEDLAPQAASKDKVCYAQYMPQLGSDKAEHIQQATNALSITLCKRDDPGCSPSDSNTFNMHIFNIRKEYDDHVVHEAYVMLFHRTAPFAVHAISQQPLWIHGREGLTTESGSIQFEGKSESAIPFGHTERFYITSMSWRTHAQKYHGYIDDVLFLSFGIEDSRPGAIDVKAGDILADLAFC